MSTGIFAATCRTPDCPATNYTLTLVDPGDLILCGGCSTQITDVQPPLPAPESEVPDDA